MRKVMPRYRAQGLCAVFVALAGIALIAQPQGKAQVRQIRANGVDLSYVEQGSGTPVVFIHGAVMDLRYWDMQRDAFSDQYRFVAYTYRYHGTGPWPDDGKQYSAEIHAADLAALISALKGGPVHLVGLSYGGMLAAMVAMDHPQSVRTLTLAEPGLFSLLAGNEDGEALLQEWNKGAEPVMAAVKAGDNALATRHLSALVMGGSAQDFDKLPAGLRELLTDNARTLPLLFAAPPPNITCDMLSGIKVPTLVVRGERTPRIFSTVNDEVARCVTGSRLAAIANASHPMSYDNPAEFNRTVLQFLSRTSDSPSRRR